MKELVFIAMAGAAGAVGRYGVNHFSAIVLGQAFPFGTLIANVAGCFGIGALLEFDFLAGLPKGVRLVVAVGFLGSFTTFSTFGYQTVRYLENQAWVTAAMNIILNIFIGFMAVWLGILSTRYFLANG